MACSDVQPYQKQDVLGYYKLLNLPPSATPAEIRKAYYALALLYHPDKNSTADAEVMFKAVVQAYEVLHDPEKRKQYDVLTYAFDKLSESFEGRVLPSFLLGSLLGNVFIYGASVGIIVCPLWGWLLAPTLLFVVVAPTLYAHKFLKLSALCCGIAIAPLTAAELGIRMSASFLSGAASFICGSLYSNSKRQIEDIEEGWVNMGDE